MGNVLLESLTSVLPLRTRTLGKAPTVHTSLMQHAAVRPCAHYRWVAESDWEQDHLSVLTVGPAVTAPEDRRVNTALGVAATCVRAGMAALVPRATAGPRVCLLLPAAWGAYSI